ncbi:MAG: hypothetical protein SFW08_05990 [Gemmatimonadaceae bacterium]|nr:hypothetical protein [Gemmatimonadaceae bacterium]
MGRSSYLAGAAAALLWLSAAGVAMAQSKTPKASPRATPRASPKARVPEASTVTSATSEPGVIAPKPVAAPIRRLQPAWYAHPTRWWAQLGGSSATGGLGCAICRPTASRAVAANAAVGYAVKPQLVVGVQGLAWLDVFASGLDQTALGAQVIARWYPWSFQPLAITGGVGGLGYRVDDGGFVLRAQTLSAQLTVSWELPARNGLTLTPYIAMLTTTPARLRAANGFSLADDARFGLAQAGLALSLF